MKITYRGWAGHFCAARHCLFHLNTLLEHNNTRIVVSTVGAMQVVDEIEEIGFGPRYYETMAFRAKKEGPYWDADVSNEVSFDSNWSICAASPEELPEDVDNLAVEMHQNVVEEIRQRMEEGDL